MRLLATAAARLRAVPIRSARAWAAAGAALLLTSACSAAPRETTAESWRDYLETVRRLQAAGAPLTPDSPEERQAIARFQELLTDYTAEAFAARTHEVYADDAFFNDSLVTLRGAEEIERHFIATTRAVEEVEVEFVDLVARDGDYYFRWLLTMRSKRLAGGEPILSAGMSHVRFDASGRVVLHQDFWDSTGGLFEHARGLGWLLRRVKLRL